MLTDADPTWVDGLANGSFISRLNAAVNQLGWDRLKLQRAVRQLNLGLAEPDFPQVNSWYTSWLKEIAKIASQASSMRGLCTEELAAWQQIDFDKAKQTKLAQIDLLHQELLPELISLIQQLKAQHHQLTKGIANVLLMLASIESGRDLEKDLN